MYDNIHVRASAILFVIANISHNAFGLRRVRVVRTNAKRTTVLFVLRPYFAVYFVAIGILMAVSCFVSTHTNTRLVPRILLGIRLLLLLLRLSYLVNVLSTFKTA